MIDTFGVTDDVRVRGCSSRTTTTRILERGVVFVTNDDDDDDDDFMFVVGMYHALVWVFSRRERSMRGVGVDAAQREFCGNKWSRDDDA